jgi:hypothetical protein
VVGDWAARGQTIKPTEQRITHHFRGRSSVVRLVLLFFGRGGCGPKEKVVVVSPLDGYPAAVFTSLLSLSFGLSLSSLLLSLLLLLLLFLFLLLLLLLQLSLLLSWFCFVIVRTLVVETVGFQGFCCGSRCFLVVQRLLWKPLFSDGLDKRT